MKKTSKIIISSIIAISFIGVGCLILGFISNSSISGKNFGYTIMSTSTQSANKISSRYKKFNGQKTFDLKIKETQDINLNIKTKSGSIKVKIDNNDSTIFTLFSFPQFSFNKKYSDSSNENIKLGKGSYTITLTANKHSGGFTIKK